MPISENEHSGPEDLGYESSYDQLRPEGERAMARRMREAMDQAGIDPEIADALGAPSPSDMRQALQWGVDLGLINPRSPAPPAAGPSTQPPPPPAPPPVHHPIHRTEPLRTAIYPARPRRVPDVTAGNPGVGGWMEIEAPATDDARRALGHLRNAGSRIYWGYTGLRFREPHQNVEDLVDALVIAPSGIYLIELAPSVGSASPGSAGVAAGKAQRLSSLLSSQRAFADGRQLSIEPLVLLTGPHPNSHPNRGPVGFATANVCVIDGVSSPLPGILARITEQHPPVVDVDLAARVGEALEQADIRPKAPRPALVPTPPPSTSLTGSFPARSTASLGGPLIARSAPARVGGPLEIMSAMLFAATLAYLAVHNPQVARFVLMALFAIIAVIAFRHPAATLRGGAPPERSISLTVRIMTWVTLLILALAPLTLLHGSWQMWTRVLSVAFLTAVLAAVIAKQHEYR